MVNDNSNQSVGIAMGGYGEQDAVYGSIRGYRLGEVHPTAKDIYEQARRGEPSIPHAGRYTGFKRMVQYSDGGLQGVCHGATDARGGQGSTGP